MGFIYTNLYIPESCFNTKIVLRGTEIPMIKIRWSWDCLIFIIGILMLVRWHLYIERTPVLPGCSLLLQEKLTHWGRVTHICVSKLTIIGSDKGLSPDRRQAIIWTNAGILLIRTLGTNFSEILGEIHSFSFKKMHLKMSSAKGRLFSLGLNELTGDDLTPFQWASRLSTMKYDHCFVVLCFCFVLVW